MDYRTMREVSEATGVPYSTLANAIWSGRIPEPTVRRGRLRLFSPHEAEAIRRYFAPPTRATGLPGGDVVCGDEAPPKNLTQGENNGSSNAVW